MPSDPDPIQSPTPQNIHINVSGAPDKHFFDRHFAAILGASGVVVAAVIAGIYKENESKIEPIPDFAIATTEPTVGKPVKFNVAEASGYKYVLSIAPIDAAIDSKPWRATPAADGIFYAWTPDAPGEFVAELQLFAEDGKTKKSEKQRKFVVLPRDAKTAAVSPNPPVSAPSPPAPAQVLSQRFSHRVGDNSSCSERNVVRNYDLCLPKEYSVVDWTGSYQSMRNGSADVVRHPSQTNCVVLSLRYSDSGRGVFGDCKGNGWVDYAVTLNGRRGVEGR